MMQGAVHGDARWLRGSTALTVLSALLLGSGCAPPDTPPALGQGLGPPALELLRPDTVRSHRVGAGVWYRYVWSPEGPWAVHLVEADLERCELALEALRAQRREAGGQGREEVSSMVTRAGLRILAAVNADFFTPEGSTVGSEVAAGRVTAARTRPAVAWRPGADPWMGSTRVTGDTLWAGWPVPLGLGDGVTELVGGYPELLAGGSRVGDLGVGERPGFAASRHPRTAVGFDPAKGRLWLVVVDGRQPPHSVGMTLPELSDFMSALGATEALNLDGGGSTVVVVGGKPRNRPSDQSGERPVVNALALVRDPAFCRTR